MMRKIVGTRPGATEDWVSWIRRATKIAKTWGTKSGVRRWTEAHAKAKWEWAGHATRRGEDTWVARTTRWRDSQWQLVQPRGGNAYRRDGMRTHVRPQRRRWLRWEDSLRKYAERHEHVAWQELTNDSSEGRERWKAACEKYVRYTA